MISYIWPLALVVIANVFYQICAKCVPGGMKPFASLIVTYGISLISVILIYIATSHDNANLVREFSQLNWAPVGLGFCLVALEAGFIFAYKAGWEVSTASIVQSAFLAIILIAVGYLLFHEAVTMNKVFGVIICLVGLYFINK